MKSVLISIKPKWCKKIACGEKTLEIRKSKPKIQTPFKCFIYCTAGVGKNTFNVPVSHEQILRHYAETGSMECLNSPIGNCKVIGEFICDAILQMSIEYSDPNSLVALKEFPGTCLTDKQIIDYLGNSVEGYAWHISNMIIYEKPRELADFAKQVKIKLGKNNYRFEQVRIQRPPQSWCYVEEGSRYGHN